MYYSVHVCALQLTLVLYMYFSLTCSIKMDDDAPQEGMRIGTLDVRTCTWHLPFA